ncbi:hypothetical protein PRZ48_005144 [Zasmidium cellare]|uniref:Uncharacterized protein n=1 Tax=Zasmidium cellare TaxID=395010 RepID=A0ABR0ESR2_ZASCE|nr:hypothetical protein PRZ48_005144 [Zasmidium cellare]
MSSPAANKATILRLLANITSFPIVQEIVAPKATYVSLNFSNLELQAIEPWRGTHENVSRAWRTETFDVITTFCIPLSGC